MTDTRWAPADKAISVSQPTRNPDAFFESVVSRFRSFGAEHILITGLPLPGRDLGKLVLYQHWGDSILSSAHLAQVRGSDDLLRRIAVLSKPTCWNLDEKENSWIKDSSLIGLLQRSGASPRTYRTLIGIHVHHFNVMQVAICVAGPELNVSERELMALTTTIQHELAEMHSVHPILSSRPGELSTREKLVLSMTAEGKTAGDIAGELHISQRTVHAHLQNASEKMQAANKTQTVVEAMRYGQIQLR
ncbi:LuxR C-terminal-related transcriptional regulator [uncultured Cohaesibacter sp.]|uniref:helix-turn-helix transcriptional regulator n=1 Tax=uncultured Cohaesibacter sp. TaxID=1002546 RepID=UPI002A0A1469|nr:LuxR C-terminal-related transcriptional regulator [uncultured Cohaesibacter sp.]